MDYPYGEGRRAEEAVTPRKAGSACCVVRDGDTYVKGVDGKLHQPLCKSARDEKAVTDHVTRGVVSDGGRTSPPVSASNTRADPKPCLRCARYGVKAIEGHT